MMTDNRGGPMGMSAFPRVHHGRKRGDRGHGLRWWLALVTVLSAVAWVAVPWLRAKGYLPQ